MFHHAAVVRAVALCAFASSHHANQPRYLHVKTMMQNMNTATGYDTRLHECLKLNVELAATGARFTKQDASQRVKSVVYRAA